MQSSRLRSTSTGTHPLVSLLGQYVLLTHAVGGSPQSVKQAAFRFSCRGTSPHSPHEGWCHTPLRRRLCSQALGRVGKRGMLDVWSEGCADPTYLTLWPPFHHPAVSYGLVLRRWMLQNPPPPYPTEHPRQRTSSESQATAIAAPGKQETGPRATFINFLTFQVVPIHRSRHSPVGFSSLSRNSPSPEGFVLFSRGSFKHLVPRENLYCGF